MPFIENVPAADIPTASHHNAGPNSMLIQIVDPCGWFPDPKHQFKEVHQFRFLDAEKDDDFYKDDDFKITDEDAAELVRLLQHAKINDMNVVVHCVAGLCRSGAVVEIGVMMGFTDPGRFRSPNLMVKHKMMKVLGWAYDEQEERIHPASIHALLDPDYYTNCDWYDLHPNWEITNS